MKENGKWVNNMDKEHIFRRIVNRNISVIGIKVIRLALVNFIFPMEKVMKVIGKRVYFQVKGCIVILIVMLSIMENGNVAFIMVLELIHFKMAVNLLVNG